jgi:hypothetical protein
MNHQPADVPRDLKQLQLPPPLDPPDRPHVRLHARTIDYTCLRPGHDDQRSAAAAKAKADLDDCLCPILLVAIHHELTH